MDIATTILNAAKIAKVSGVLLLGICSHESGNFKLNFAPMDKGSPSFGSCQLKHATAKFLGFKGDPKELMNPEINAKYAALYLQYQQTRYGEDWVALTAAYNAGSFFPNKSHPQCPKNLGYVQSVQKHLPDDFKYRLDCGNTQIAGNP